MTAIDDLQQRLRQFATDRDWEQFHTPKNLAMALAGEAGELLAEFQWLTPEESLRVMDDEESAAGVRDELAVMIYLCRLADVLQIDLASVAVDKIGVNQGRFPPTTSRVVQDS